MADRDSPIGAGIRQANVEPAGGTAELVVDRKAECLAALIARQMRTQPKEVLVVGCGSGVEAAALARQLDSVVIGVDLDDRFDARAARCVQLQRGDACNLEFESDRFDLVYSYHALEHIPNYRQALREMRRVLKPTGWYCIGTPNRSRLIGYLGSSDVPLRTKLRWNCDDWRARIAGRFRNDLGAHAGFTECELLSDLKLAFGEATSITTAYYLSVYRRYAPIISLVSFIRLSRVLFPSVYFMGRRLEKG